ncbi:MAG: pre-peptidase C-terminal domain-containing protein [Cyanobacteria bacterium SBLK]|nr:pre-peptidase C-terminal domain-containing protein [Cyanobacteria bacterium SBLK]
MNENQSANSPISQPAKSERCDRIVPASQQNRFEGGWQHLKPLALALGFIFFSFFPIWQLWDNSSIPSALASPAPSARVGTIAGDFAVNGNGGANYTIPIEVPPGINGVQPNISLVYNSQQGNGLLGMGWELAGLSAIERCGKIIDTDGVKGGINFDSNDRFCFDGQRLMAVSGSYGANGTVYHTERETWIKATSYGSQNGPQYFEIVTKDGHVMEFGKTSDSRMLATGRSDNAVQIWALNEIGDRNGNTVKISYEPSTSQAVTEYPTEIRYTGHPGIERYSDSGLGFTSVPGLAPEGTIQPLRLVKFEYEGRSDDMMGYVGGSKTETTKLLSRIKTYVDLDGDGNNIATATNLVKEYRLSYGYNTVSGRSLLTQLKECDAIGTCLPATAFNYESGDFAFSQPSQWTAGFGYDDGGWRADKNPRMTADVNGDGLADVVGFGNGGVWIATSNGTGFDSGGKWISDFGYDAGGWRNNTHLRMTADVNGDGLADIVGFKNYGVWVATSNGTGFDGKGKWIDGFGSSAGWDIQENPRMMADVNGDGLADVVGFGNSGVFVATSNGTGFNSTEKWIGDFGYDAGGWRTDKNPRMMADVNGDGLADVVGFGNNGVLVATSNGQGFNPAEQWIAGFSYDDGGWRTDKNPRMMADVNGDGLADVVGFGNAGVWIATSNGTGFDSGGKWISDFGYDAGGWRNNTHLRMMADINGDGLADVVGFKNYGVWVATSNGTGFNSVAKLIDEFGSSAGWDMTENPRMMADVSGDGIADVVGFGNNGVNVALSKGKSNLLTTITNGLGGVTQIEYKPLTDSTVYSKEVTETENNNSSTSADGLGSNDLTVRGSISSSSDEDWFAFDIPSSRNLTISVAIANGQDLDWYLYQESDPSQPVTRGFTTNNPEKGTYNATNPGRYYLKVNGWQGATGDYTLTLQASDSIVKVQTPLYVVSRHTIKDKASSPTNTFIYDHQYEGAKIDRHRGWLGFGKTILVDRQNQTRTVSIHHTDFPLLGVIAEREIWDLQHEGRLLNKTDSSYQTSKDGNGVYKMWETEVEIEEYTEGTHNYTLKRAYEYDSEYKNPIRISDLGDTGTSDDDLYTCIAYHAGTGSNWWKGFFPTQQKIVTSETGCSNFNSWNATTDLRWKRFSYDDRMNAIAQDNWQDKNSPTNTTGQWISSTIAYDTYGNVTSMSDPSGNTSAIAYDAKYHTFPVRQTAPLVNTTLEVSTEYEPKFGIKTKAIDVNGNTSMAIADSDIDGFGRILAIQGIKPDSSDLVTLQKNEFTAESNGMSVKTWYRTQWEGNNLPDSTWLWDREYIDGLGRSYKTESQGDRGKIVTNRIEFNTKGETSKESLPYYAGENQYFLTYEYNTFGEIVKTTDPIGAVTEMDYNRLSDRRQITYYVADPRENANGTQLVKSVVKSTSRGWLNEEKQADDGESSYTYDRLGQVTAMTDPLEQTTEIVYSSLGQVLSETTPETGTNQYTYNENGEIVQQFDAQYQRTVLGFDALSRPTFKRIYKDGFVVRNEDYQYDTVGVKNGKGALTETIVREKNTSGQSEITVRTSFSYNNRGEIETEKVEIDTDGDGNLESYTTQYTYDAVGRPHTMTYPDGAIVRYAYNDGGELYTVELKDTGESNFTPYATYENYTALGDIGKVTYNRNQVESNYTYDAVGRITDSRTRKGAHTYFDFDYTWNKANKILAIRDNAGQGLNQNFSYDIMGRLSGASGDPYADLRYEYDRAGNITKRNDTTYAYKSDKKHQLASATYDVTGNTTQWGAWAYTYDAENHLRRVEKNSVMVNEFTYDDSGSRLKKVEADGTTTYYVAPFYEVVAQPDNAQIHTKYIIGSQGAVAAISKNGSNVNLLAAVRGNGATLEADLYDPHSWGGVAKFLGAKFTQLSFNGNLAEALVIFAFVGWLACALGLWFYRLWRSASPESGLGRSRAIAARFLAEMGSLSPFSADRLTASQSKGWLLQVWHRPAAFSLALFSFASVSLSGTGMLATLTPGANGPGYSVAGQVLYFHYDQLGSTTLVTDAQGNEVSQVNYEPYGAIADSSSGQDAFRPKFTGKEYDSSSELYYFGSRYYDAHLGRFLTPDPARQYFSPYVYGNGDPLTGIDPTGELFFTLLAIFVGAVVGAYLGGAAVNDSYNPASWDWSSGKTWGGIIGGAILGGAAAGAGIAAGGAIAAAGLSSVGTTLANMAVGGLIMGTLNASFTAMAGGSIGDVAAAFGIGFAMGALFAVPTLGPMAAAIDITQNAILTLADPSVEGAIQLGVDILGIGISRGMRLKQGGKKYARGGRKYAGGCSSFAAGTEVATAEGEKAIDEIIVGDTVLAYDEDTGAVGEYPVSRTLTRIAPESVVLTVGDETITTTPKHEFYTANGWVEAEHLHEGNTLVRLGGKTETVTEVALHQDSTRVYNFEVETAHTYYVSREELLVHNPKGCGWVSEGGKHGRTKKFSEKLLVESNHFPAADSYKGTKYKVSRDRMPAVTMDYADHRIARSTGSSNAAKKWRQKQNQLMKKGQYDKAMEMDIKDMKNITLNATGNSTYLKNGMTDAIKYAQSLGFLTNTEATRLIKLAGTPNTTPYTKFY